MEFVIVRFEKRNGDPATRLISTDALEETVLEDFFEPGCIDIEEVGRVEMIGDSDYLDDQYISE
ncbi:MAG: hypothetical protein ABIE47_05915 [Pseudomonadota bacterium]